MLTGLLKIINGKLYYRDSIDRSFEPVPSVDRADRPATAEGVAKQWEKALNEYFTFGQVAVKITPEGEHKMMGWRRPLPSDGGKSNPKTYNMLSLLECENEALASLLMAAGAEASELRGQVDFWRDVAKRRKERCNYLADEMRKYRDQPAELFISVVRDTLHASGTKTLRELIAQRDIERIARQELITQRDSAHAELTQLRLVNDKLQKAVEDAAASTSSVNYGRMQELMAKERLRADQNGLDLATEKQKVSDVRSEYFAMRERAEKAEADARVKGENLKTAKELLLRCANFISHVITTRREPGHIYDVVTGFLRDSNK